MLPFQGAIYSTHIPDPRRCLGLIYTALSALLSAPLEIRDLYILTVLPSYGLTVLQSYGLKKSGQTH